MPRPKKCGVECLHCACGREPVKCKFTRPFNKSPRQIELEKLAKLRKPKSKKKKRK